MSINVEFANSLSSYLTAPRWLVGYSGGADSSALLHLAVGLSKQLHGPPVVAVHVNHGLSVNADAWQQHCAQQCQQLGVALIAQTVDVLASGKGLEQAARAARYTVFEQHLGAGELLLQGHHQNDQAETVLYRLFRGAGIAGLAAIKASRPLGEGLLLRPLLAVSRADIEAYLAASKVPYINDESNDSNTFDRNYIRRELLPLIIQRWPQANKTLSAAAEHAHEAAQLLNNLADIDLRATVKQGQELNVEALARLSDARQKNVLRFWLAQRDWVPTAAQLQQIKQQFVAAKPDASPQITFDAWQLNRCGELLYCEPVIDDTELAKFEGVQWSIDTPLQLAENIQLSAEALAEGGLFIDGPLRLSFERAGKRFQPAGRAHSTTLKKLMQASAVLPWHRNLLPLLYSGDHLAAVVGVGVKQGLRAASGQQGYRFCLTIGRHSYLCE